MTTTAGPGTPVGFRFLVLGNSIEPGSPGRIGFLERQAVRTSRTQAVRRTTVEPPRELVCVGCGQRYTVSARNARNGSSRCAVCRGVPAPTRPPASEMFSYWTSRYSPEELAELAAPFA